MTDIRDLGRVSLAAAGLLMLLGVAAPAWADSTERVSVGPGGVQGDGDSGATFGVESEVKGPAISAHGRFVVFTSFADNLVPGDTNGWEDVFIHDRQTGTTERVNLGPHGRQGNQDNTNFGLAISADGRFVAFASQADTLVPGDTNRNEDVFVRDRKLGATERVSVGPGGRQSNRYSLSEGASISADGRFVAFDSGADNLVEGVSGVQVYVRDRVAGRTELVSAGPGGIPGDQGSGSASISADG